MKLSNLIHEVWKDERVKALRIRKSEVRILAEVFLDHIGKGLLKYGVVKLHGLFTLEVRKAKGRKIRNPQNKKEMYIDDYHKLGVIPSKNIKQGLKEYKK